MTPGKTGGTESFEIVEMLGAGGFAQTWLARVLDRDLIREWGTDLVALKIPLDKEKARVLQKELVLTGSLHLQLRKLESRHLVRYYGFEVFQGKAVMVMEYISGGCLRNLLGKIGRQKAMRPEQVKPIIQGIVSGLEAIHRKRIIHRDIKPENILMDGLVPKITDLGVGRMLQPDEMALTAVGTLFYLPPELALGHPATYNVDFWPLGVMLFEMLFGCFPFGISPEMPPGRMLSIIVDEKINLVLPPLEGLPDCFRTLLPRLLERNPQKRIKRAGEILDLLDDKAGSVSAPADRHVDVENEIEELTRLMKNQADPESVKKRLADLIESHPDQARIFLLAGQFFTRINHPERALELFARAAELSPGSALPLWECAVAYDQLGKPAQGLDCLNKALAIGLDPGREKVARSLQKKLQAKVKNKPETEPAQGG